MAECSTTQIGCIADSVNMKQISLVTRVPIPSGSGPAVASRTKIIVCWITLASCHRSAANAMFWSSRMCRNNCSKPDCPPLSSVFHAKFDVPFQFALSHALSPHLGCVFGAFFQSSVFCVSMPHKLRKFHHTMCHTVCRLPPGVVAFQRFLFECGLTSCKYVKVLFHCVCPSIGVIDSVAQLSCTVRMISQLNL